MTDRQDQGDRLHGWKEIANHFDRTPRTVQRWEREFGLPVHRIGLGKAEVVHALRTELEAWERQRTTLPPVDAGGGNGKAAPVAANLSSRRRWWGLALLPAALLAIVIWWPLAPGDPPRPPSVPTHAAVEANTLRVFAADGHELWSHRFEHPVHEPYYTDPPWYMPNPIQVEDLDGDGTRELLALAMFSEPKHGHQLYCFEADGRRRFTWAPSRGVTYGDNRWEAPFFVHSALVGRGGGPPFLWVTAVHHLYFPAVVAKLDRTGRVQQEFWTNGHVNILAWGAFRGRSVLFAGCANNEFKTAGLVVIDAGTGSGSTPALNPAYRCRDCPPGQPLASLVFPVPDLLARTGNGGIAAVMTLLPNDGGGLSVGIGYPLPRHSGKHGTPLQGAFYEFDRQLRPIRAEFTDQYIAAHRRAEGEGLIDHKYDPKAEERQLFPILSWNGSAYVPDSPKGR